MEQGWTSSFGHVLNTSEERLSATMALEDSDLARLMEQLYLSKVYSWFTTFSMPCEPKYCMLLELNSFPSKVVEPAEENITTIVTADQGTCETDGLICDCLATRNTWKPL